MRKYDIKNKRNFTIVAVVGIILIVIFSVFVKRVIETSKVEYYLSSGSILLDKNKNTIVLEDTGIIKIKWNLNYYLLYKEQQIEIGNTAIVYNPSTGAVNLYGKFYEVEEDSDIVITKDETIIYNAVISKFYKISDRKYLLIDKEITSLDGILNASNYLLVELDKSGNATLSNNEVNLKTFAPTTIKTSTYTFDIANEILNFGKEDIDLKKIIGSTNKYEKENNVDNNGGGGGNTTNNVNPNTGVITNEGGSNISDDDLINLTKRTSIIKLTPSTNSITVDYLVYDPRNEYTSVTMEVKDTSLGTVNIIYLSKVNTSYVITNLIPSTTYELTFRYAYLDNEIEQVNTFEKISVTTLNPDISIEVTKVTNSYIYYKIYGDSGYSIDSLQVRLLSDDNLITSKTITNVSGEYSDSFDIRTYSFGDFVTLMITNVIYEGHLIDVDAIYKYKNVGGNQ